MFAVIMSKQMKNKKPIFSTKYVDEKDVIKILKEYEPQQKLPELFESIVFCSRNPEEKSVIYTTIVKV